MLGNLVRVARLELDKYHFLDEPDRFIADLSKCGTRVDLFTFLQRLPDRQPKFNYPMEWDNLAVLSVSTFDHWLKKQIRFAPRGRLRQAEKKGVVVREVPFDDALVKGIWEIYNESPVRQGRSFAHFGKDLESVHKVEATYLESSIFIGAYLGEKLIGFIKLVADDNWNQVNLMNILSLNQHRDKCPTNALIAQAVRSCADRGIPYLVYQNFSYGKEAPDSVSKFKEVNGFERFDLPRYYVPLTSFGSLAFRLGLHHRLVDRLPSALTSKLRALRAAWHHRRLQSVADVN